MKPRRMATEAEKAYIAEHYATGKTSDIALKLGMTPDMVRGLPKSWESAKGRHIPGI